jgi:NAD(P)H-dependent FMN reductase
MNIVFIASSHRANSNSERAARLLSGRLAAVVPGVESEVISLHDDRLPFWNSDFGEPSPRFVKAWKPIEAALVAADALVCVTPEWAGMAAPALKNFLLMPTKGQIAHKPGLIVSVSTGTGGAYPVAELKMSGTKNSHLCWIPDSLVLRHVNELFPAVEAAWADGSKHDVAARIDYTLVMLTEYASALRTMRATSRIDYSQFPNGL